MKRCGLIFIVFIWVTLPEDILSFSPHYYFDFFNTEFKLLKSAASKTPLWSFTTNSISDIDISSDGNYISVVCIEEYGGTVYLFNTSRSIPLWSSLVSSPKRAISVAVSSNGAYVVAGTVEGNIFLFNGTSGQVLWKYTTSGTIRTLSISSNGSYIVAGTSAKNIYLFNYNSSIPLWSYKVIRPVRKVAISSKGNIIVMEDRQESIYVFTKYTNIPLWIYRPIYTELVDC
ncbi:MAG: WD40 repeat domain-containing protein [Promethearchaeota archaeon]|jgi:WD40 repeat protein